MKQRWWEILTLYTPLHSLLGVQDVPILNIPSLPVPALTYAWVFNEYPYYVQQDSRRFVSQETGNLYVAKVEPSDVGNYTCVVMNTVTKGKVHSSPTALILKTDGES